MKRRYTRLVAVLGAIAVFLAFGGIDLLKEAQARWRAYLQPPTVEQVQRAPDPPPALRAALPREAVRGKMWLSDPPRPVTVAIVLVSIVTGTLLAMYFTGRSSRSL